MGSTSEGNFHSGGCCNMTASEKSLSMSPCNQCLISGLPGSQSSLESTQVSADPLLLKMRLESSTTVSCSGTSGNSNNVIHISSSGSELDVDFGKKQLARTNLGLEDSQDPFAFDEDDFEPSQWDLLSGRVEKSLAQDSWGTVNENKDFHHSVLVFSQQESSNTENRHSQGASCSSAGVEEKSNLLADCLLTAVKVLVKKVNSYSCITFVIYFCLRYGGYRSHNIYF